MCKKSVKTFRLEKILKIPEFSNFPSKTKNLTPAKINIFLAFFQSIETLNLIVECMYKQKVFSKDF